eukprot:XP_017946014.1 PREDICTED: rho GTPase-activating protein 42-like [Xenopus tropicalis]
MQVWELVFKRWYPRGDSYSSSPSSTPIGSIESLSSHSSEQNSTTKSVSLPQRDKKGVGIPWVTSAPSSNGQKGSSFWTTSPESSSKDDTTKTDVESDCQSVSSITSPGNASPPIDLTKKSLYGLSGLKRSQAPSLRSLSSTEAIGIKSRSPSTQSLTSLDLQDVPKVHPELSPKIMRR